MNHVDMCHSLGFYVHVKRMSNVPRASFEAVEDYHDFLSDAEITARQSAMIAGFGIANPLIPLEDITLTQVQYGDIVHQVFNGIAFMALSLPHPPPIVQHNASTSYFDNYIQSIDGDKRTKEDAESTISRINTILSAREADRQRVNGLVVGRVQSGKTRNYVGLMLKAVDEGWNVVIVLTSSNTALAEQTEDRIKDDFAKANVYTQIPINFRTSDIPGAPTMLMASNNTSFYWGVAMKEVHNLGTILTWLKQNSNIVPNMRILVIDDEADNATPDSNTGKSNQLTESEIEDLIAVVREEGEKDYTNLADWMENVPDVIVEAQEKAESDPGCREDESLSFLTKKLKQAGGTVGEKLTGILADNYILDLLELQQHMEDGALVDVKQDILTYFNKKGKGPRSTGTFFKFLNTILEIAIEKSAINRYVCELIDRAPGTDKYSFMFSRCAYIAYTATPYANILNERPDQTPLYADFIKPLATSPKYFGLDKIFGRDYKKKPDIPPNMNIVDEIGCDDKRYVLNPIQGIKDVDEKVILPVTIGTDLRYVCSNPHKEDAWGSMMRAIAWAFCTAGARRHLRLTKIVPKIEGSESLSADDKKKEIAKIDHRWTTMMINVSPKQGVHDTLLKWINGDEKNKGYLQERCGTIEAKQVFLEECRNTWEYFTQNDNTAYSKADFDDAFNGWQPEKYGEISDYPAWETIREDVQYFIDGIMNGYRVHPIIINSANKQTKENQDNYNQKGQYANTLTEDHLWIVIGGNTIGRGLTLAGLTVSYFDRLRKTVAVDTLTQMGRWFGYRVGYELLPRIWMTSETVCEMKKTAFVEGAMHEEMQENFAAGYSPSDPEHYQRIYSWGRKLSGRARAQTSLLKSSGTLTTTDAIYVKQENIDGVYARVLKFIGDLGAQVTRSVEEYKYGNFPMWANIDRNFVKEYIKDVLLFYPEDTRQKLWAIIREIEQTVSEIPGELDWHVVIGEPVTHRGNSYSIGVERKIFSGHPESVKVADGVARYGSVRSDMAFYAMIPTDRLNYTDAEMVGRFFSDVLETVETKIDQNGVIARALAGYSGTVEERLSALIADIKDDPHKEVPPCIRDCLPESFRNRSSINYREAVYANAGHVQPILQLYLLTPPEGSDPTDNPMIAHAFYWPGHAPDDFALVSIGMAPTSHNLSEERFGETVAEILSQNGFPMPVSKLKVKVLELLPECSETFFDQHIAHPANGIKYAKFPGKKAYYHTDWAQDPVAKVRQFVLERAAEILADGLPHERNALAGRIVSETPNLGGLFNPNSNAD